MAEEHESSVDALDDIFQAIGHSVKLAQHEMQRANAELLKWFMEEDKETGKLELKMIDLWVPDGDGKLVEKKVPLMAIIQHRDMTIEELEIDLKIDLGRLDQQKDGLYKRMRAAVTGSDNRDMAEVKIKFKGIEPTEGMARINNELVKLI